VKSGSNTWSGANDFSGATSFVVRFGTTAPASGDCDTAGERGNVYVRTGDPATIATRVSVCTQTGASTYAWNPISHKVGTTAPATCVIGEIFFDSDATAGSNWLGCTATDTWTTQGSGSGGAPTGAQYLTLATDATLTAERVLTPDTNMSVTDAGAGGAYTFGPDTAKILSRATHQAGALGCSDSGGDDTYTCNMTPTLTTYTAGMVVEFTATVTANTGGATLQIDSLAGGGKAIKLCDGTTDPETGDIAIGRQVPLRYDGTVFRLPCKGGSSGTPTNTPYFPWGGVDINNVIGASTALNVRFYEFDIFSPGKIITSLSTATGSTGGIFAFALYSADCTTLLAQTDTVNVSAFDDDQIFVFTSPQTLTAGKYVLGIAEQAGTGLLRRTFGYYLPVGGRDSTNFPYFRVTGVDATYSAPNLTMPSACTGTRVSLNAASPYALAPFIAFF